MPDLPPLPPLPPDFLKAFSLTPGRIELVQRINDQIRARTNYGTRTEKIQVAPAYRLTWSNVRASWHVKWPRVGRVGEGVSLDANEILVQGVAAPELRALVNWLEPLPLYRFSYEAKERDIFDPLGWLRELYRGWEQRGE